MEGVEGMDSNLGGSAGMEVAKDLGAGTIAGVAQLLVGHPFDTIKVKLQSQPKPPPGQPPHYTGAIDAVKKTVASEGFKGLYKGMGAPLATVAVFNAVLFTSRGLMEKALRESPGQPLTIGQQVIAGMGAGVAVSFVACPTELVKCRLQAQSALAAAATAGVSVQASPALAMAGSRAAAVAAANPGAVGTVTAAAEMIKYTGPMDVARHVLKYERGVRGLFKGMVPTMLREVPGNAALFGSYEATKQLIAGGKDTSSLGRGSLLTAGGVAGAVFWMSVYPADVVKSVIQVDDYRNPKYKGTIDAFKKVYAAEGIKGLYRGFGPAMARSVPANAACFLAYEIVKEKLG
ncbi:unnamed protein product [Calypogeia fissa]